MTAEKRQTYTVEFKREAIRLMTVHGYGVAEAARDLGITPRCSGAGNANMRPERTAPFLGKAVYPRTRKRSTACARRTSVSGWSVRF